jgi:ClpP class serine protease
MASEERVRKILSGEDVAAEAGKAAFAFRTNTSICYDSEVGYGDAEPDSVAIIDVRGPIMRYDSWCDYGAETYSAAILQALNSDNISAIIVALDTPGGSTSAMTTIEPTIRNATKPVVAFVDDMAFSAGYFIAAISTKVVAAHPMAEVGCIGVMATMYDCRDADKMRGMKVLSFYPDESKFKNKASRDALDGKPDALVREQLAPFARYFQDAVKTGRPSLNLSVEGLIEGKEFYAKDAKEYGLVDEIMSLDDAILYAQELSQTSRMISF